MSMAWQLGIFVFVVSHTFVYAQYPVGPPPLSSMNIQTTGGITYFVCTATLPVCDWIENEPLTNSGTNLSLTLTEMRAEICPLCFDCYHIETNATVLGKLPGGDYRLTIFAPDPDPFGFPGGIMPLRTVDFSVPPTSGSTLAVTPDGRGIRIEVSGAPAAAYVVEASSTLTNWTPVYARASAPFTFATNSAAPFQFYRVSVASGRKTSGIITVK